MLIYCIFLQEQRLCGEASVLIQALLAVTEGLLCSSLEGDRWAKKFYKNSFQNEFCVGIQLNVIEISKFTSNTGHVCLKKLPNMTF